MLVLLWEIVIKIVILMTNIRFLVDLKPGTEWITEWITTLLKVNTIT